jgi:hypothetical protein
MLFILVLPCKNGKNYQRQHKFFIRNFFFVARNPVNVLLKFKNQRNNVPFSVGEKN